MGLLVKINGKDEWHFGPMTPEDEPVFYWDDGDGNYRKLPNRLIRKDSETDKVMNQVKKEIAANDKKLTECSNIPD